MYIIYKYLTKNIIYNISMITLDILFLWSIIIYRFVLYFFNLFKSERILLIIVGTIGTYFKPRCSIINVLSQYYQK